MKKSRLLKLLTLSLLTVFFSCSTKKDAFLNRGFHNISTKYNVMYNGNLAFDQAKQQLDDTYQDNFWQLLPIEPLKIEEKELVLPDVGPTQKTEEESTAQGFDKAEEKAIKAVQKHSMEIDGRERNKEVDDAYLLLGKARYYSQRFVPALEAFNFILENYTDLDLRDKTRVWQAKTLIRLQNEDLAIETLQFLLNNQNLSLEIVENAHTTLAMAYTAMDSTHLVIKHLDSAVLFSNNIKLKARNLFIMGQLYRAEQKIDSSNMAFEALSALKKAPYRYQIHAQIDRAKNYNLTDSTSLILSKLKKLIKDRQNRPYLDELFYQKGLIELENDSIQTALKDFKNSLNSPQAKKYQKELTYEQIGNIYFDKANFQTAGSYYDSVVQISQDQNVKRIRRIIRKRQNLKEVILYETLATTNDSILKIAGLPKSEQEAFYQNYIDKLKEEEEEAKKKLESTLVDTGFGNFNNEGSQDASSGSKFYFYNQQVAGFGTQEFRKKWGNRPLEDNWRLSDKNINSNSNEQLEQLSAANTFDNSKKYELDYYLSRLPSAPEQIDSITLIRNDAYYKLGLIYKEQFNEYLLAAERLEKLLSFDPKENIILPTKYHLYKIYSNFDLEKSNKFKEEVVNNYPDSRYASIILNPDHVLTFNEIENTPEAVYNDAYCDYDYLRYDDAFKKSEAALVQFEDLPIVPKFELLKAYILMKTKGAEAFKEALNYVAINFPNSEEGKHAVKMLDSLDNLPSLDNN